MRLVFAFFILCLCYADFAFSQVSVYSMAYEACRCLGGPDQQITPAQARFQIDLCVRKSLTRYKAILKKEGRMDTSSEALLRKQLSTKMMDICPEILAVLGWKLIDSTNLVEYIEDTKLKGTSIKCRFTDFKKSQFAIFTAKDSLGQEYKLLWMDYFLHAEILKNGVLPLGNKYFDIWYEERSYFNAVIHDYFPYKVITGIRESD